MRRSIAGVLGLAVLLAGGMALTEGAKPERPSRSALTTDAVPVFPDATAPASWGRLVGAMPPATKYSLTPLLVFEAQDGTVRIVEFGGGPLKLQQIIRRSAS